MASYSDIDLSFTVHPVTKDLVTIVDSQDVIASVRNLLNTNFYERPFQPLLGSNLNKLLFELVSPLTANFIEREVGDVINNYEPRAQLDSVVVAVNADQNSYTATIQFYVVNQTQLQTISMLLERLR